MSVAEVRAPSEWARVGVIAATLANVLVLAFVSLPVIGFFFMTFNGMSESAPLSLGGKAIWLAVMVTAAALPLASIYFAWRWLRRGLNGRALAAGFLVPVGGALLFAAYGPAGMAHETPTPVAPGASQL